MYELALRPLGPCVPQLLSRSRQENGESMGKGFGIPGLVHCYRRDRERTGRVLLLDHRLPIEVVRLQGRGRAAIDLDRSDKSVINRDPSDSDPSARGAERSA